MITIEDNKHNVTHGNAAKSIEHKAKLKHRWEGFMIGCISTGVIILSVYFYTL